MINQGRFVMHPRRTLNALSGLLLAVGLAACSSNPIKSDYDYNHAIDFSKYRTYAFISDHPMIVGQTQKAVNPLVEDRIEEGIRIAMNGKGYTEVKDPEEADMAISFTVGSRDQIKVDSYPASYGAGWSRRGYYYGYGMGTDTYVRQYTEGQLAIDIFDVASHTPAFHGSATKRISESDRKAQQAMINTATAQVLAPFPTVGGTLTLPDGR
jgi:hypothetical protein